MNKDKTLLIMAAGRSSRYESLKQFDTMGPNGESLIDYAIYDAIKAGFTKIIIIIRKDLYSTFKATIEKRISSYIRIECVFQDEFHVDGKNLQGTAAAILSAKEKIKEPFVVVNADDFYGKDAYKIMLRYLEKNAKKDNLYCAMTGYLLKNTLPENKIVKRAVCEIENNKLLDIIVCDVKKEADKIIATTLGNKKYKVNNNSIASMNMYLFNPEIFKYIENKAHEFLKKYKASDKEFLITDVIKNLINEKDISIEILNITKKWYGVTYKEDKKNVVEAIKEMIEEGIYPEKLW